MSADEVDAINACGTGTPANDGDETAAIKVQLQQAVPQCDLGYVPNIAREGVAVRSMLSSSFAFGGTNAVLALRTAG